MTRASASRRELLHIVVALMALLTVAIGGATRVHAGDHRGAPAPRFNDRVGVHLDGSRDIRPGELATAEDEVKRIFAAAGVQVSFSEAETACRECRCVSVLLLSGRAADRVTGGEYAQYRTLGQAARGANRAYVFVERVERLSAKGGSDPGDVLGIVIAHEVGHLLLPVSTHDVTGLMRPDYNVQNRWPRRFSEAQAALIRGELRGCAEPDSTVTARR